MSLLPLLFASFWSNQGGLRPVSDYDAYNFHSKPMGLMRRPFFNSFDSFDFDSSFDNFDRQFEIFDRPFPKMEMPNWMMKGLSNAKITNDGKTYQLTINVSKFKPEEVEVNVKGRSLVVKAERNTNGYVSMVQSYTMPYNVDSSKMETRIEKGMLTIKAPLKAPEVKKLQIDVAEKKGEGGTATEKPEVKQEKDKQEPEKNKQEKKEPEKEKQDEKQGKKEEQEKKEPEKKQEEKNVEKKEPEKKQEEKNVEKKEPEKKHEEKKEEKKEPEKKHEEKKEEKKEPENAKQGTKKEETKEPEKKDAKEEKKDPEKKEATTEKPKK